jgi:hypothetical protein
MGSRICPFLARNAARFLLVRLSLLAYGVVAFFTAILPSWFGNPILSKSLNRRSTFNYGVDILNGPAISLAVRTVCGVGIILNFSCGVLCEKSFALQSRDLAPPAFF